MMCNQTLKSEREKNKNQTILNDFKRVVLLSLKSYQKSFGRGSSVNQENDNTPSQCCWRLNKTTWSYFLLWNKTTKIYITCKLIIKNY